MAKPTQNKAPDANSPEKSKSKSKIYRHTAPTFIKLAEGEQFTGVFIERTATQFGTAYKFKTDNGIQLLGGNRFQLDDIITVMETDDKEFPSGLQGHRLTVKRLRGMLETKAGRTVSQYEIEHEYEGCPHGCVPF